MKKDDIKRRELLSSIRQDTCTCKDCINDLCNHANDIPDLKIGFELGMIQGILLRMMSDESELE